MPPADPLAVRRLQLLALSLASEAGAEGPERAHLAAELLRRALSASGASLSPHETNHDQHDP